MSDSVRPHRRQPTRLCRPWDSPGKNTGVACHFLLQSVKVKSVSCVRLFVTPWTVAYQAPLSMGFSGQEYWSGVPLPSPMGNTRQMQKIAPSWTEQCRNTQNVHSHTSTPHTSAVISVYRVCCEPHLFVSGVTTALPLDDSPCHNNSWAATFWKSISTSKLCLLWGKCIIYCNIYIVPIHLI